ncbi:cyanobactin biosynthesis PatC/TenC/TruC family protein [Moorena sp. SIO4G3]|uniref:cyanobactin biosynthesis PatC/TenC/TruC family protein n=1 Tax=Moorena sp. SIO4G3 TaxID=2607821 RepID=UPI00142A3878|nr:cyanobactin biosynthesis PatC/TenC/TruC family protein [Moorena sp. SIO4G3]NEO81706.1 cyanobactin biosynthesis PatC/TenC/TruC family protein [Moorena sp. SIO4G3]
MPEEETKTPRRGRRRKTQAKPKAKAAPAAASPSVQPEVNEEKKSVLLATGLEDYARWKVMFKDQKPDNDPPFRRGRIWA